MPSMFKIPNKISKISSMNKDMNNKKDSPSLILKNRLKFKNPQELNTVDAMIDTAIASNDERFLKYTVFYSAVYNHEPFIIKIINSGKAYLYTLFTLAGSSSKKTTFMYMVENEMLESLEKLLINEGWIFPLSPYMARLDKNYNNILHYVARMNDPEKFKKINNIMKIGSHHWNKKNKQNETPIDIALICKNYGLISHVLQSINNISYESYLKIINSDFFINHPNELNVNLYTKIINTPHIIVKLPELQYKLLDLIHKNIENQKTADSKYREWFSVPFKSKKPDKRTQNIINSCLENTNYSLLESLQPVLKITSKKLLKIVNALPVDPDSRELFNEYVFENLNPVCKIEI